MTTEQKIVRTEESHSTVNNCKIVLIITTLDENQVNMLEKAAKELHDFKGLEVVSREGNKTTVTVDNPYLAGWLSVFKEVSVDLAQEPLRNEFSRDRFFEGARQGILLAHC